MTADFLLELLCEEIPARMQARARGDLERLFGEELAKAGLRFGPVETYSTPRRLALIARDLPLATEAVAEEVKGPRVSAPRQALEGFLRKTGLNREQLAERDGIWFARVERPGRGSAELLGAAVEGIVGNFPWPKSMRWGEASASTASLRWVRPLHSVLALLGDEIVAVAIEGVKSGATTLGHRFHHPGPITIGGVGDYVEKLRACHVIVDHREREALIREGAREAAAAAGLTLIEDEALVVENAGLTEWPVPLLGRFDADFLDVPREVIVLTMRTNQKYFACTDGEGKLAPAFLCTANIAANDGGAAIVEGNRRVLAARLSDARFFWQQDLKVPLEEQAKKLSGIVFHEKLGTIADKVERVAKLAEWLVTKKIVTGCSPADARRAAELCKADLVSGMVGEFPELQGVIGGYLAAAQGEPSEVADAIRDHYKPVGQGDEVPTAPVTVAVSLADKLDSLAAFYLVNERPTGSKDPFALRRATLAAIQLILSNQVRIELATLFDTLWEPVAQSIASARNAKIKQASKRIKELGGGSTIFGGAFVQGIQKRAGFLGEHDQNSFALLDFFADRLKVQQREAGARHDLIDAVFALGGEDDLVRLLARVKALQAFVETGEGADLLAGYKRAANILKKEGAFTTLAGGESPSPSRGEGWPVEEVALVEALDAAEPKATAVIDKEDFTGAMAALASLRGPIDLFFDKVTVNDPDPAVRARRLALLARFRDAVHRVADFSKIEG